MNTPLTNPKSTSDASRSRSNIRSGIMIGFLVLFCSLLGWEYRGYHNHAKSLERLQMELARYQVAGEPMRREDVLKLIQGSPVRQSEIGDFEHVDVYTWSGLVRQAHIRVASDAADFVKTVENDEIGFVAPSRHLVSPPPAQKKGPRSLSPDQVARVEETLARAEKIFRTTLTVNDVSPEFYKLLQSVADDLPTIEVSTVKGQLKPNSFKPSRGKNNLFAFRFMLPALRTPEADVVNWLTMTGQKSKSHYFSGMVSRRNNGVINCGNYLQWLDRENDIHIEGFSIPPKANVFFRSMSRAFHGQDLEFIHWILLADGPPDTDFEYNVLLFAGEAGKNLASVGADEISDFMGLKTDIKHYDPTPEGIREAFQVVEKRLSNADDHAQVMPGRILRPVMAGLEEHPCAAAAGTPNWKQMDFPSGAVSAVRIRIPGEIGSKADLFGAIVSRDSVIAGLDRTGQKFGKLELNTIANCAISDSPIETSSNVVLFSNSNGGLEAGMEILLWVRKEGLDDGPVYVTFTAIPHKDGDSSNLPIKANEQPRASAEIAGVKLPGPPAPKGSTVLGYHERSIAKLLFTPDSQRLVSVDYGGHAEVWNVEPPKFEGRIEMTSLATQTILIDPESKTLFSENLHTDSMLRWNLESREPLPALEVLWKKHSFRTAAFGPEPYQLVVVHEHHAGPSQFEHRFDVHDLRTQQPPRVSDVIRESGGNAFDSLVFLPSINLFAAGRTHATLDDSQRAVSMETQVELWSPDLSHPVQVLPVATYSIEDFRNGVNNVHLSVDPSGRRMAAISMRGELRVWDVATRTELMAKQIEPRPDPEGPRFNAPQKYALLSVSLAPDGESVAVTEQYFEAVTVWKISDGTSRSRWKGIEFPVERVVHSSDGKWVATSDSRGAVRLWENRP